jgi:hypothetical protein
MTLAMPCLFTSGHGTPCSPDNPLHLMDPHPPQEAPALTRARRTADAAHRAGRLGFSILLWITWCLATSAHAQSAKSGTQAEPKTDLNSRIQLFSQSAQNLHQKTLSLFHPLGGSQNPDHFPYILRQIEQNRERWLGEINKINESGERTRIKQALYQSKENIASGGLGEEIVNLAARIEEHAANVESIQKRLDADRILLDTVAREIITTAMNLLRPVVLITGQEDANKLALKLVLDRVADRGFAITVAPSPAAPSPAAGVIIPRPTPPTAPEIRPTAQEKSYRIYSPNNQSHVLLKREPNPLSETVARIPKTASHIIAVGEPTGRDENWISVKIGNLSGFFVQVEHLCLMEAPPSVSITPGRVEKSWNEAVTKYPELGTAGSPAQEKFSLRVQAAKLKEPESLKAPGWPLAFADQILSAKKKSASSSESREAPEWMEDPRVKEVQQTMEDLYRVLTTQFSRSPLTSQLPGDQADWINKTKSLISSQPAEFQATLAANLTSDRARRLGGLLHVLRQPSTEWKTYPQGTLPPGDLLSLDQAATLRGVQGETPLYLVGKFTVTAIDRNRAVMRSQNGNAKSPTARVIVEYLMGSALPTQGATVVRKPGNALLVREIRRAADGQINIFARDITDP